ncbi:hypothetical protein JOB18_039101 [Solea senegalensis]|uniref:Uncharacterized protein n=1 Tax=Solea senegalensis TaxID=28829 RepID=A0AAV6QGH8_SOLSE|nr:hypothetical protein JOB18_039101 [Solea senegalensis]
MFSYTLAWCGRGLGVELTWPLLPPDSALLSTNYTDFLFVSMKDVLLSLVHFSLSLCHRIQALHESTPCFSPCCCLHRGTTNWNCVPLSLSLHEALLSVLNVKRFVLLGLESSSWPFIS